MVHGKGLLYVQVWHSSVTDQMVVLTGPTILFLEEWFIRRKGLAFGIMVCSDRRIDSVIDFLERLLRCHSLLICTVRFSTLRFKDVCRIL